MLGNSENLCLEKSQEYLFSHEIVVELDKNENIRQKFVDYTTSQKEKRETQYFFLPSRLLVGLFSFGLTIGIDLLVRKYFPWNVGI